MVVSCEISLHVVCCGSTTKLSFVSKTQFDQQILIKQKYALELVTVSVMASLQILLQKTNLVRVKYYHLIRLKCQEIALLFGLILLGLQNSQSWKYLIRST